ncbi:hypothetical protein ACFLTX_03755 [Chloroflexota bacterium]
MIRKSSAYKLIIAFAIVSISLISLVRVSPQTVLADQQNIQDLSHQLQATYAPTQSWLGEGEIIVGDVNSVVVQEGTSILLGTSLLANDSETLDAYANLVEWTVFLDGNMLPGGYYGDTTNIGDIDDDEDDDFGIVFYFELGVISPGTHQVVMSAPEHEPIGLGFDESTETGPYERSVTIIVESPPDDSQPPTQTSTKIPTQPPPLPPTSTPSPTITQTPTSPPTHTNTPEPSPTTSPIPPSSTPTRTATAQIVPSDDGDGPSSSPSRGDFINPQYRDPGPYVPEFTTYIPTPLDISLDIAVILANLLLAALLMIPFAYANELLGRMLKAYEEKRRNSRKASNWLTKIGAWLSGDLSTNLGGGIVFRDKLRILFIILVYGLVFSFMDNSWKPFSREGLTLFISMAAIFGLVGLVDDFIQWRMIRKWDLPINLKFKPFNLLVAGISILVTRFLPLLPGLMFGTPELMETDDDAVSRSRKIKLLLTSVITFSLFGLIAWSTTIWTRGILQDPSKLPGISRTLIAGIEAFMLIIVAVVIDNFFAHMLAFPGSFGALLKKISRVLWYIGLFIMTFIFIHTLINPDADILTALRDGNVILFVAVVASYVLIVFISYLIFRYRNQKRVGQGGSSAS